MPHRDPELDLVEPRAVEQRVEREGLGAATFREAERGIRLAAVRDDPGHIDERFNVVEQRRPVEQPALRRIWRAGHHLGTLALD